MKTPCINVCRLDARSCCVGCGRSVVEIANWSRLTDDERAEIMTRLARERDVVQGIRTLTSLPPTT